MVDLTLFKMLILGDPLLTERFHNPPTNTLGNYTPSMFDLATKKELQDWMFKDFNYAAWLWVKGKQLFKHSG
jgi:hypothetical protein